MSFYALFLHFCIVLDFHRIVTILIFWLFTCVHVKGQAIYDNCATAKYLCAGEIYSVNNNNATIDLNAADGDGDSLGTWGKCYSVQNSVWFKFTTNSVGGSASVGITGVKSFASGNPSAVQAIVIKPSNACDILGTNTIACNENQAANDNLTLTMVTLSANTMYYVQVDGVGDSLSFTKCNFAIGVSGQAVVPEILAVKTDVKCNRANGSIEVTSVNGGSGTYEYALQPNGPFQTSNKFENLSAGTYNVYVKDAQGCINVSNAISINYIQNLSFTINTLDATCNQADGSAEVIVTGGTAPYIYKIPPANDEVAAGIFTNLYAGTYYIYVKDANGCDTTAVFNIKQTNGIETAVGNSTISACNASTGTITISGVTGSTTPSTYSWNNQLQSHPIQNVPAGNHNVIITDNNGCNYYVYEIYVEEGSHPNAHTLTTNDICDKEVGTITISNSNGGEAPYTYQLENQTPGTDTVFSNLTEGGYTLYILDKYGCKTLLWAEIVETKGPTAATASKIDANCNANNGELNILAVDDGTAPFEYSINGGAYQSSTTFAALAPATYTINVRDANACSTDVVTAEIKEINKITDLNPTVNPVVCASNFGSIFIPDSSVTGGVSPYSFSINGASASQNSTYNNLPIGSYKIKVEDKFGCTHEENFLIAPSNTLECSAGPGQVIVRGMSATLQGASAATAYTWSPTETLTGETTLSPVAKPKVTTVYEMSTTSAEGCECKDTVTVLVINKIDVPNAFTPNGDGNNDVWEIRYLEYYENAEITVYNRWGQKVFNATGYPDGSEWDGKFNGVDMPAATYYYVIELNSGNSDTSEEDDLYKGSVTIVR